MSPQCEEIYHNLINSALYLLSSDLMIELQIPLIKGRLRDRKNQIGIGDYSEKSLRFILF
jgi:hypothetical protein